MNADSIWNKRYSEEQSVYGKTPNAFLTGQISRLRKGNVLSLAEGQGRNIVYLAKLGFDGTAVDSSSVGLQQAAEYVQQEDVQIQTVVADLADYSLGVGQWDNIISIFCHLPYPARAHLYSQISSALKPGGVFLLEAYTPQQVNYGTGGPQTVDLLADLQEYKSHLHGMELIIAREIERDVNEGLRHHGLAAVVQILAVKS